MPNHHLFPNTRYVIHNDIQECGTWSKECRIGGYLRDMHRNGVIRVGTGGVIPVNPKRKERKEKKEKKRIIAGIPAWWLERLENGRREERGTMYEQLKITLTHVNPMSREPSSDNHGSHTPNRHVLGQAQQTRSTQSHLKVIP